jgi:hypothetical protein
MNPRIPIETIAYTIPKYPNTGLRANVDTIWLTIPNPGKIKI